MTRKYEARSALIDVADFIERFVFLKNKTLYSLIALWVISTHKYQLFDYTGYLFAHSPEPGSGKSRLLEVLDPLVYNSSGILVSPTEAVLFRTAVDATQLLDEVDSWSNRDELRSVLNAGYHKAGTVTRMQQLKTGGYRPVKFSVFAPRALAGIGLKILNRTTLERTFATEMMRQTRQERRERFRPRKLKGEIEELREQIELFWVLHEEKVEQLYDNSFPYLERFTDRTMDITEPLATILEAAYHRHPRLEEARQTLLEAISITRNDQRKEIKEHRILRELARLAKEENPLVGNSTELAEKCSNLPEPPSPQDISRILRKYGFKTKGIRKGGDPKYRYILQYEELAEILVRYAGSDQKVEAPEDE